MLHKDKRVYLSGRHYNKYGCTREEELDGQKSASSEILKAFQCRDCAQEMGHRQDQLQPNWCLHCVLHFPTKDVCVGVL